jgi:hypothetical protein
MQVGTTFEGVTEGDDLPPHTGEPCDGGRNGDRSSGYRSIVASRLDANATL